MRNLQIFQTVTHGKCILAGEHAVLRGYPALVTPVNGREMIFAYNEKSENISVITNMPFEEVFLHFFWAVLNQCLETTKKTMHDIHGEFNIQNNIEIGVGLGFSAALCVSLTRWLVWQTWIKSKDEFNFAKKLEDFFHGASSGIDILGVMAKHLMRFDTSGNTYKVQIRWHPKLYLSYSGQTKNTKKSVEKVNHLMRKTPDLGKLLDLEMQESVRLFEKGLALDEKHGLRELISAIDHANHCFSEWGLIPAELQQHMDQLKNKGAVAVKPTGAGGGGYVLSLWLQEPAGNEGDEEEFISVF